MGRKSLDRVHRDIQRESIKREILKHVERKSIPEIATGLKGCFLLALKKRRLGAAESYQAVERRRRNSDGYFGRAYYMAGCFRSGKRRIQVGTEIRRG